MSQLNLAPVFFAYTSLMKTIITIIILLLTFNLYAQQEMLVWSDEFEIPGAPDPTKWNYDLGAGGWGNNEIQNYTNNSANSRVENGKLIINAVKWGTNWTSARLNGNNRFEFKYGRVIFRAKLPVGSGTWPALWMLGENFTTAIWPACGEIDVMEHVGKTPGMIHCSIHTPSSFGATINTAQKMVSSYNTAFHDYQVRWKYNKIEFLVDSLLVYTYSPSVRNASTWPFDKPFFIIMNIAMGGNFGSDPKYESGGLKNGIDPSLTSATMEVEYVRVYQYPNSIDDSKGENLVPGAGKDLFIPNPCDGYVKFNADFINPVLATFRDIHGNEVCQTHVSSQSRDLDISFLPRGLYFVSLRTENKVYTQKLVIR